MDQGDGDAALTTLATSLLPILEAFHHRHRNQHGASHWWSVFQLIRRGARSLAADLRQSPPPPAAAAASKSKSKTTTERRRQQRLLARVALLRDHTIPKAYLCFSQLIADNQHATLGLLLLSVLASITSILTPISPPPPQEPHPDSTTHHTPVPDTTGPADSTSRPPAGQNVDADKGVAISRDSVPGRPASSKPTPKASIVEDTAPTSKKKKRRAPGGSEAELKKKKKKSKKGGDELSSLFGSL